MALEINPEDINRYVADAILNSAIGEKVKEAIAAEIGRLGSSYENPYRKYVEAAIIEEIKKLIEAEYREQIKELVKEKISEQFVNEITNTLWDKFLEKRY